MRRLTYALMIAMALGAAGHLAAQDRPTLTFGGGATTGVQRWDGTKFVDVGTTDVAGKLLYNPAVLGGKPLINLRFDQCLARNQNVINLFPATVPGSQAEENKCPQGCTCNRKDGGFIWGNSASIPTPFGPAVAGPQSFFFDNPWSYAVVGGGAAAGIIIATSGGSSTNNGGSSGGTETRTFSQVVLNTFTVTITVSQQSGNCNFTGSSGTATFTGNQTATSFSLLETPANVTFPASGSTTQNATNKEFQFTGAGTGSTPSLGIFTTQVGIFFDVNANTFSGSNIISASCGTVSTHLAGSR
jgi:hypothetical protein